jgi:hypothetical protein
MKSLTSLLAACTHTPVQAERQSIPFVYHFVNQCSVSIPGTAHPYETTNLSIRSVPHYDYVTLDPRTLDIVVTFVIPQTGYVVIAPLPRKDTA